MAHKTRCLQKNVLLSKYCTSSSSFSSSSLSPATAVVAATTTAATVTGRHRIHKLGGCIVDFLLLSLRTADIPCFFDPFNLSSLFTFLQTLVPLLEPPSLILAPLSAGASGDRFPIGCKIEVRSVVHPDIATPRLGGWTERILAIWNT